MQRCLQLATKGLGFVAPNPMVGAVLVYEDKIIGEGWHKNYGEAHAEVNCINNVSEEDRSLIEKSTLYVSLEPCNHFGKTPPCTDLILKNKIKKVVIGCRDTFALVNGTGIQKLRDNNVEVIENICQNEAVELNKRFFTFHQEKRPYIILKWAQSADGFLGQINERTKITDTATDIMAHKWRSEEAAIMIGKNTALIDDPSLTNKLWRGKNPVRIITDSDLEIPHANKIFNEEASTIILNALLTKTEGTNKWIKIEGVKLAPGNILQALWEEKIQSVFIEGGATLLNSFIDSGLWNECRVITNTKLNLGNGIEAPIMLHSQKIREEKIGMDRIEYFLPAKQAE